jgi:CubicO group peptidase (beta-lactamase class C family)
MKQWKVPGLALAIVEGDRVVVAKGYGVRRIGEPAPVDDHTLFAIGSATKTFTATAVGMLADEHRLSLDSPVTRLLPGFELGDPYVTREVTLRDLLSHRTGVAGGDLLWASGELPRDEIVRRLRFLPQTWSLRSRFDYSNVMVIAAGQALAAVAGEPWDSVIHRRILDPLGMRETVTSIRDLPSAGGNVATPHDPRPDAPVPVPWRDMDNTAAAGGINSNVRDMARWLRFQLAGGTWNGHQLVSRAYLDEMRTPQIMIRREGAWAAMSPDAHFMAYGLGWIMSDYHGRLLLQHGGGIDGMSAMVGLVPEANVGVVVLSNLNGNQLPAALMMRVVDAALGRPPADWSGRYFDATRKAIDAAEAAEKAMMAAKRVTGTSPTLPLAQYVGTYHHDAWGDATVRLENGKLVLRYGTEFEGELEHLQYDTFQAHWRNPARGTNYLNFTIDGDRRAARLDLYLWLTATFDRTR